MKYLFTIVVSLFYVITFSQSNGLVSDFINDSLKNDTVFIVSRGSCPSPDGPVYETTVSPPDYQWLDDNGYCNPDNYGTSVTVCWTFTPSTDSIDINSGYSQSGCNQVSFGNFILYNNSCNQVGTGLSFGGLTLQQYTWCMDASSWGGGPSCVGFTDFCPYYFENGTPLSPPLPIELLSFRGIEENGEVILKWITSSELNNDLFEIHWGLDIEVWEKIGTIKGAGNSKHELSYYYIHSKPEEVNYYKLRQIDYDGKFKDSDIIVVTIRNENLKKNYYYINVLGQEVDKKYNGFKFKKEKK